MTILDTLIGLRKVREARDELYRAFNAGLIRGDERNKIDVALEAERERLVTEALKLASGEKTLSLPGKTGGNNVRGKQ